MRSDDLYALICTYFQLLTGRTPYNAPSLPTFSSGTAQPCGPAGALPRLPETVCQTLALRHSKRSRKSVT